VPELSLGQHHAALQATAGHPHQPTDSTDHRTCFSLGDPADRQGAVSFSRVSLSPSYLMNYTAVLLFARIHNVVAAIHSNCASSSKNYPQSPSALQRPVHRSTKLVHIAIHREVAATVPCSDVSTIATTTPLNDVPLGAELAIGSVDQQTPPIWIQLCQLVRDPVPLLPTKWK
jgi:hypothetical protein